MWKHKNFINLQLCATFKHFYDAGTIGSGTVKFRHYSQQEPSSGETWVLNETLTTDTLLSGTSTPVSASFTSNGNTFYGITRSYTTNWGGVDSLDYYPTKGNPISVYDHGTWSNTAYRTITFATPPTGELLAWLQANGTKQGGGGASNT